MLDFPTLMVKAQCGELSWLCCVGSPDRLVYMRDLLYGMSDNDIALMWKLICACQAQAQPQPQPSQGGNPGGSGPGGAGVPVPCGSQLLSVMCDPTNAGLIIAAKEAVDLAVLADPEPNTKTALLVVAVAFELMEAACADQTLATSTIAGLCKVVNLMGNVGSLIIPDAIVQFWTSSAVGQAVQACCSDPTIASAATPDWAAVLPA